MELRQGRVAARGLEFPTLEAGPENGPLALCLHGFPDSPRTWRLLLPELARAGWSAVAPALRGYAPAAIPEDGVYHLAVLARDALALADALGHARFALIGHDWGAAAAHAAAAFAPERISHLVTMAVPHQRLPEALLTSYDQQRRSFYIFLFQLPFADSIVAKHDFAFLERLWRDWSPGYRLPAEELEELKKVFRQPGVLPAALGYYRSAFAPPPPELASDAALLAGSVPVPALYFHGWDDGAVGAEVCRGLETAFPKGVRVVMLEGAGHFLHLERPEIVAREILAHLESTQ